MTEDEHSPGPWRPVNHAIMDVNGFPIGQSTPRTGRVEGTRYISRNEALANARFMATAPQMLSTLVAIRDQWHAVGSLSIGAVELLDAIIAKARGET